MRTLKDIKKFGKGKIPKNRSKHRGYQEDKDYRKAHKKRVAAIKDCIVYCRPFPENSSIWDVREAERELRLYG